MDGRCKRSKVFVDEAGKNEIEVEETGENIDPEKHKENIECEMEGPEEDGQ